MNGIIRGFPGFQTEISEVPYKLLIIPWAKWSPGWQVRI